MAISSQINIDVNAAEFTALKAAFDKYETALKKMPAAWKGVGAEVAKTKTSFEAVANSIAVQAGTMAVISKHSSDFYNVTTATARHWSTLALSTGSVAKNIVGATESLLKWTGIIGLVTGAGGLFGFDRLAQSVSSQRTAALGTGGTYGARAAFVTNFRRFGDPEALLSRVAEAQTSIKESVSLKLLGLTQEDLKGDPADVAIKALQHGAQIANRDKATGFPVGSDPHLRLFSTAERIRLRDHPEEIEEMIARMRADQKSGRLNLSPADQKGYQDFTTRMEKASREIETIFVKGLVKLAGPLGELSDATVKLVDKFTEKALPDLIKDLGGAIEWLAKEVEKPAFVSAVEGLVSDISSLAASFGSMLGGLARFARWLGVATPVTGGPAGGAFGATPGSGGGSGTGKGYGTHGAANDVTTGPASNRGASPAWRGHMGGTSASAGSSARVMAGESAEVVDVYRQAAIDAGIDPDRYLTMLRGEGLKGFNPKTGHWSTGSNDRGTSWGPGQLHYASNIPGFRSRGLGDEYTEETGRRADDMKNWRDVAAWTAREIKKHGYAGRWHGYHGPQDAGTPPPPAPASAPRQKVSILATPGGNVSLASAAAAAGSP